MNRFSKFSFALLLAFVLFCASTNYAFQGRGGEGIKPNSPGKPSTPVTPTPKGRGKGRSPTKKPPVAKPSPPSTAPAPTTPALTLAELIVNANSSGCTVIVDGEVKGTTNSANTLKIAALKQGNHTIIIRKDGYREEKREVALVAGHSETLTVELKPILSLADALTKAEEDYRAEKYGNVIESLTEIVKTNPENARVNLLLGKSYYMQGKADSWLYLEKAFNLGERIELPVKHRHGGNLLKGKISELCTGIVVFQKSSFEFHTKDRKPDEEDFIVTASKILQIKNEAAESGKLFVEVLVSKGRKEAKEKYDFYSILADVGRDKGLATVSCSGARCQNMMETVYKLLQKFKQ